MTKLVKFLLTRLSRGVTVFVINDYDDFMISTHTPLARRDRKRPAFHRRLSNFYSHASREA